jgi:hypothetical protein
MKAKLENLAGGAVAERFREELTKAVENICDPNTEAKKKRTIVIKCVLEPNQDRTSCSVDIECSSKLVGNAPLATALFIGVDPRTGEVEAVEPQQGQLFPSNGIHGENVVDIKNKTEAKQL